MNDVVVNILRFIILLLLQVLLFNNMDLFGFVTPFPYILFILIYPLNTNRAGLITISFFLGLILDMFNNSGGVHAAACVTLAFFRESFLKFAFGISYEYHMLRITEKIGSELITYLSLGILLHHSIVFVLEIFNFNFALEMLIRSVSSSIFTLIIIILILALFKPTKR